MSKKQLVTESNPDFSTFDLGPVPLGQIDLMLENL